MGNYIDFTFDKKSGKVLGKYHRGDIKNYRIGCVSLQGNYKIIVEHTYVDGVRYTDRISMDEIDIRTMTFIHDKTRITIPAEFQREFIHPTKVKNPFQ